MRAAIDIGGTFTDILLFDERRNILWSVKTPSDYKSEDRLFLHGLQRVLKESGNSLGDMDELIHATTVVTNALLQGNTSRVGLLVTEGFRDLLEIGRQTRPHLYDLAAERTPPIVSRELVMEVRERVGSNGEIVTPMDEYDGIEKLQSLSEKEIDVLAINLLFSFSNDSHEIRLAELAKEIMPEKLVFLSSKVLPEFREFERASTTVVAAAVAPNVVEYLRRIKQGVNSHGRSTDMVTIMHSGGGTLSYQEAKIRPHTLIESGPAAGVLASVHMARSLALQRVISFDMGGTTAKASLVLDGKPQYTNEYEVGSGLHHGAALIGRGYPIRGQMIDIYECGAGAGCIAWVDSGGHLKVGPQSAGADPGPACYGKGGQDPTVTDAHVVLGHLDPKWFLGGQMKIEAKLAEKTIENCIANPLGLTVEKSAQGILSIVNAKMLNILRLVSVARGYDPRDFTLLVFGGAGPLHGIDLAEAASIYCVVVPPLPAYFSAMGLLYADMAIDYVENVMLMLESQNLQQINLALEHMLERSETWFRQRNIPSEHRSLILSADLRYYHQNYELNVFLDSSRIWEKDIPRIRKKFNKIHEAKYGHMSSEEPIQVVNLRLRASKCCPRPVPPTIKEDYGTPKPVPYETKTILQLGKLVDYPVYRRKDLPIGFSVDGPAIVQEDEATTLIREEWQARVGKIGNLIITKAVRCSG